MDRRTYLATFGTMSLTGCLGMLDSGDESPESGTITCADGLAKGSDNGPSDRSWPTDLYDMQNTGQTDAPGPSGCVETRWSIQQDPPTGISAGPAVADGRVYVPNQPINDTWFTVHDAKTGEQLWQHGDTDHEQLLPTMTPSLVDDSIYLADGDNIARVDLESRSTDWFRDLSTDNDKLPGIEPPRIVGDTVYAGLWTGEVLALDKATGQQKWIFKTEGLPSHQTIKGADESLTDTYRRGEIHEPPAVTADRVFVPSWDLSLYALDAATGERLWQFRPGYGNLDKMQAPTVVDGKVYAQTVSAILYVLDAETGDLLWTYDEYGEASDGISPVVDDDSVYIIAGTSTENLFLVALDREDGSVRWEHQLGPPFVHPAADADTIYIDLGRHFYAIDKETGERKWTLQMSGALSAPAAISDEAVFVASNTHYYGIW